MYKMPELITSLPFPKTQLIDSMVFFRFYEGSDCYAEGIGSIQILKIGSKYRVEVDTDGENFNLTQSHVDLLERSEVDEVQFNCVDPRAHAPGLFRRKPFHSALN